VSETFDLSRGDGRGGRRVVALVARREIRERVRSRAFLVSTLISVAVLAAVVVIVGVVAGDDDPTSYDLGVVGERPAAVAASMEALVAGGDGLGGEVEITAERYADEIVAERAVRDGDIDAALVGTAVVVDSDIEPQLAALVEAADREVTVAEALAAAGADEADIRAATEARALTLDELSPGDPDEDRSQLAFIGTILLYGQLLGFGYWVASGIVEEKASRVVELLLAKTTSGRLLAGKVLGIGVVGFVQLVAFVGAGLGMAAATGSIDLPPGTGRVAVEVVAWFVLGFALYACLFAVGGAIASRPEELQSTTLPITLVAMAAFFAAVFAGGDPGGVVARVATFVPPAAPLVLPVRAAAGELPLWEAAVGVSLVLATIAVAVPLAARIYAGGALFTRGPLKVRAALARATD
jgi:ABC-2 type transport system permease protein